MAYFVTSAEARADIQEVGQSTKLNFMRTKTRQVGPVWEKLARIRQKPVEVVKINNRQRPEAGRDLVDIGPKWVELAPSLAGSGPTVANAG